MVFLLIKMATKEYYQKHKEEYKQKVKEYREKNPDKVKKWAKDYRERNKERLKEWREDNKEKIKEWKKKDYIIHREKRIKSIKNWQENNEEKYKKINIEKGKLYRKRHPEKTKAQSIVNNYHIKIPKGQLCVICNKNLAIERHHPDYNKPLEIIFLCRECHNKIHNPRRRELCPVL